MPSFALLAIAWCRRCLARLQRISIERLVACLLLAGAIALLIFHGQLSLRWLAPLWVTVLAVFVSLLCRWVPRFFGPVFLYDLVRTARMGQQTAHRCFYAVLLLFVLSLTYWLRFPTTDISTLFQGMPVRLSAKNEFANMFFTIFMALQLGMVLLITPLYTSGAIAEEKERRSLEFLLATDLSSREIVLGMLGARLANLLLLLLVGLPVVSFLEFMGGVEPELVLASFALTLLTTVSLGGMSILVSVHARTALNAAVAAYFWTILLFLPLSCAAIIAIGNRGERTALEGVVAMLLVCGIVHLAIAFLCCGWAISGLRTAAQGASSDRLVRLRSSLGQRFEGDDVLEQLRLSLQKTRERQGLPPIHDLSLRRWPPIGKDAVLWKEMYTEFYIKPPSSLEFVTCLAALVVCSVPVLLLAASHEHRELGEGAHSWIRGIGIALACVIFLLVGLSAAGRISREREKRTLESLLMLPLERSAILFAKWWGSLMSARWLACGFAVIWVVGILTGGLNLYAVPLLACAILVYTAFVASLGLWFSTVNRSNLRSNLFTLLAVLVLIVGPGFILRTLTGDLLIGPSRFHPTWASKFVDIGLNPGASLGILSFRTADIVGVEGSQRYEQVLIVLVALQLFLVAAVVIWLLARTRLQAERGPCRRPGPGPLVPSIQVEGS
jgi:ABC-type transport system involved in multi-copper enzyme maturation permease subunit